MANQFLDNIWFDLIQLIEFKHDAVTEYRLSHFGF